MNKGFILTMFILLMGINAMDAKSTSSNLLGGGNKKVVKTTDIMKEKSTS